MNHHKAWGISLAQHAHLPPELMQCLTREAACCCQLKFSVGEGETSSLPTYMCSQILPCITAPVVVWAPLQGSQGQVFCWEQPLLTLLLVKDRNFYILLVCHVSKRESKQEKKKKGKKILESGSFLSAAECGKGSVIWTSFLYSPRGACQVFFKSTQCWRFDLNNVTAGWNVHFIWRRVLLNSTGDQTSQGTLTHSWTD